MKNSEKREGFSITNQKPLGYAALGKLVWVRGIIYSGIFRQAYGKFGLG